MSNAVNAPHIHEYLHVYLMSVYTCISNSAELVDWLLGPTMANLYLLEHVAPTGTFIIQWNAEVLGMHWKEFSEKLQGMRNYNPVL